MLGLGRWREWQACISPHWQDQERKYSQMGWRVSKRRRWPSLRVVELQVPNQLLRDGVQWSLGPCNHRSKGDAEKTPLFGLELLGRPSKSSISPLSGVRREGVEMGWVRRDRGVRMLGRAEKGEENCCSPPQDPHLPTSLSPLSYFLDFTSFLPLLTVKS